MLLREIKNIFHLELDELYPKEEVDSFFHLLIEHHLHLERFVLVMQPNLIISKEEETPLFAALSELKLNRPIQYIIGKTHFMDLEFHVDENVLIPRPETEELVRWIIEEVKGVNALNILDIGTGSGCIAIALAKKLPNAKVFALDVSETALQVAKKNTELNEVEIEFVEEDILELKSICIASLERSRKAQDDIKFDLIVCNPPYVRDLEKKEMAKNVLEYEPYLALYVSDENPLRFYKSLVAFAQNNLKLEGLLYLEINQYLAEETKQLLDANNFQDIELRKDIFGNYRMLRGKISPLTGVSA